MAGKMGETDLPIHAEGKGVDIEKLVHMANQIAANLEAQGTETAVLGTFRHISDFWTPAMKSAVMTISDRLSPIARDAVGLLATQIESRP
jgi:hypothetical protein